MKNSLKDILLYTLSCIIIIVAALLLKTCSNDTDNTELERLKIENKKLDSIVNAKGRTILTQEAVITNQKGALKDLTDSIFDLKKKHERKIKEVIAYYKSISGYEIVEKEVPYLDSNRMKQWEDSVSAKCSQVIDYYEANSIAVPKTAELKDKYLYAKLTANLKNITIDSLSLVDSQHVRVVLYKGGLFKKDINGKRHFWLKKKYGVQVLHTNPLLKTQSQQMYYYTPKQKLNLLPKAALILTGFIIANNI